MISSPLLAKQYFPRQQIFLGSPLQVNQKAYAKQAKKCRSVIKILVTPSVCSQFLGFRSHDSEHFATMHTTPFPLLFSFWLGHATSSPGCFSMALEASPNLNTIFIHEYIKIIRQGDHYSLTNYNASLVN